TTNPKHGYLQHDFRLRGVQPYFKSRFTRCIAALFDQTTAYTGGDKTNLSHDGLNPAHVPFKWVNNPTLAVLCYCGIGRADIEESKGNVAMNAWLPQASYPCGNFSDISSLENL
ncbi:hypothetical protein ADUPG1_002992, partial [Aduncisulcus paluster]